MKKWSGKLLIILFILFFVSCQKVETHTIEFNRDFILEYKDEIKLLFGEITVINKERISETFYGYTLIKTIHYDVWDIKYMNHNQSINFVQFKNRYDFITNTYEIIIYHMTEEVIHGLGLDTDVMIHFENGLDSLSTFNEIDPRLYPYNLSLENLPDELIIVLSPSEDRKEDFKDSISKIIDKIRTTRIKAVLLLDGDDAYQMDHGIFVFDGEVVHEKMSVEDAIKWIESDN